MVIDLLLLVLGLVLLLGGGYGLVAGSSALARSLGVPPVVIGLTVVAFGTSAPELVVSLGAALGGRPGIAFGNVVGSNLANIGLILGVAALVRPLTIESRILGREIPLMLLATVAVVVLALDPVLRGEPGSFDRSDGLVLLLFFSVFLYTAIGDVIRRKPGDPLVQEARDFDATPEVLERGLGRSAALAVVGLAGLIAGGHFTVEGAAGAARGLGVPESVVGLSVEAVGTSLPELVASVIAALRGETDLAVGNVVGSNIFNLLLVLGVTSSVESVPVPEGGMWDLAALAVFSVVLLPLTLTHGRKLVRLEGAGLLVVWAAFTIWRFLLPEGG